MNKDLPTTIFDLGGVLIDWNPRYLYRKLFENESEMELFLENVCTPEWNAKQDEGRNFEAATRELCEQHPAQTELIEAYDKRWEEMLAGVIEPTLDLFTKLHAQGHIMYALTNWSAEKFLIARQRFRFLNDFKDIIVSGEVQLIKPEPQIYKLLLKRINKRAEDCLFIDDSKQNINTAKELGFGTIHFKRPEQLKEEFQNYGFEL